MDGPRSATSGRTSCSPGRCTRAGWPGVARDRMPASRMSCVPWTRASKGGWRSSLAGPPRKTGR